MIKPVYLGFAEVQDFVALSASTVQQLIRAGDFPRPRSLSGRRVAWLVAELENWAMTRPVSDQLPPCNTGRKAAHNADCTSAG